MESKPSAIDRLTEAFIYVFGLGSMLVAMMFIIYPVMDQAISWLKTGEVPPRDLFWALADVKCEETNFIARGWEGMDLCRKSYIEFTDWVGLNLIANFVFDTHIAVISAFGLFATYLLLAAAAKAIGDARIDRGMKKDWQEFRDRQ